MSMIQLMTKLKEQFTKFEGLKKTYRVNGYVIDIYTQSIRVDKDVLFFIGSDTNGKFLFLVTNIGKSSATNLFDGEILKNNVFGTDVVTKKCYLSHSNATLLRQIFPFTRPGLLGLSDSFGFGDRLGIANPAHIRALSDSQMRPVLAQQSIRELDRTQRNAEDVLDAASWAVFQEGYTAGFGADADHLKTTDDIDRYARAGFTMFTFDPSAFVVNEAISLPTEELLQRSKNIEKNYLRLSECIDRYANKSFRLEFGGALQPTKDEVTKAFVKYGGVILHAAVLYRHLKQNHVALKSEVELSVDETDIPTTPTEHLFIAGELKRLGVEWVSLAPRFIGDFEKGVDYRGDLDKFAEEYRLHAGIAKMMGPYKISIHSGSDKFGVYRKIGSLNLGNVHVKTAGTSYLEALRTVAKVEPDLIREIVSFACNHYDEDRKSYHVTGRLDKIPNPQKCNHQELLNLFEQHDARQVLHVTFGKVLTTKDGKGNYLFRSRLMACLNQNEDVHYETIIKHFRKHLDPFKKQ
jgi:tagaturonate epimerase